LTRRKILLFEAILFATFKSASLIGYIRPRYAYFGMTTGSDEYVKRMSDALRSGAKMLPETCPVCSSPLFSIKDELWCLKCDRRVVVVREDSEAMAATVPYTLASLNNVLATKIEELSLLLSRTVEPAQIQQLAQTLEILLRVLRESRQLEEATRKS